MTETKAVRLTGWADEPLVEEPIDCSVMLKAKSTGQAHPCPHVATQDAIVVCARGHEKVKHYCPRCFDKVVGGSIPCRECRDDGVEPQDCPITVVTAYPRSTSD